MFYGCRVLFHVLHAHGLGYESESARFLRRCDQAVGFSIEYEQFALEFFDFCMEG